MKKLGGLFGIGLALSLGLSGLGCAAVPPIKTETSPVPLANQSAAKTELTWYGQSAFKLVTPQGHVLLIDPWLLNPVNKSGKEDLASLNTVDLILISHGHFDHVGQAVEIAKKTHARLVTTFDLGSALAKFGGYPKEQMGYDSLGNFGGTETFFNGEVKVSFVPAIHSSTVNPKDMGVSTEDEAHYAGAPAGFVIQVKNGPTIYHTGDTDVFSDMALVKQFGKIDLMLACIGDHFTMGPERAALAVQYVNPVHVAPMHYGTFVPLMTGTAPDFKAALQAKGLGSKWIPLFVHQTVKL